MFTIDLGASTRFSNALKLHSPLDRKKFHTKPAVSPIVLISTIETSLSLVCHLNVSFKISPPKILLKFFRPQADKVLQTSMRTYPEVATPCNGRNPSLMVAPAD
jgi:hypothetical protein